METRTVLFVLGMFCASSVLAQGQFFGTVFTLEPPIPAQVLAEDDGPDTGDDPAIRLPAPWPQLIEGAEVSLVAADGRKATYQAKTNRRGRFRIDVEPGEYRCRVQAAGFVRLRERVSIARQPLADPLQPRAQPVDLDGGPDDLTFGTRLELKRRRVLRGRVVVELPVAVPAAPAGGAGAPNPGRGLFAAVSAAGAPPIQAAPLDPNATLTLAPPEKPIERPRPILSPRPGPGVPDPGLPEPEPDAGAITDAPAGGAARQFVRVKDAIVEIASVDTDDAGAATSMTQPTKKGGRFKFRDLDALTCTLKVTLPATATMDDGTAVPLDGFVEPPPEVVQLTGPVTFRRIVIRKRIGRVELTLPAGQELNAPAAVQQDTNQPNLGL